jgi:hypothetical protein
LNFTDAACAYQKDLYSADGVFLRTVCYVSFADTRDKGDANCKSAGMKLVNPDDALEILGNLINYANELAPNTAGASFWIGGDQNGQCSSLKWISAYNFVRQYLSCASKMGAMCEFNSE